MTTNREFETFEVRNCRHMDREHRDHMWDYAGVEIYCRGNEDAPQFDDDPEPTDAPVSADILREAVDLMRQRADFSTPGPWRRGVYRGLTSVETHDGGLNVATTGMPSIPFTEADADHIASWHPAVAYKVAEWIDGHRADLEAAGGHLHSCDSPGDVEWALDVARAYLGGAA